MNAAQPSSRRNLAIPLAVACGIVGILAFLTLSPRTTHIPQHPLRIGFESNPPVQLRGEDGFTGLAVETVNQAAKRAGIQLKWVETGLSSEESFRKGLVDIWPLMVDLPDRRKLVHFARPWMHSSNVLLLRQDASSPGPAFTGRIAVYHIPFHMRLVRQEFPGAHWRR